MNMIKILIVDDEASVRDVVSRFLSQKGYETLCADSAETAEMFIKTNPFDLIISDIKMSGISGADFLKKLRTEHGSDVPVIFMTAYPEHETVAVAKKYGVSQYLVKPLKFERLLQAVRTALGPGKRPAPQDDAPAVSGGKDEPPAVAEPLGDYSGLSVFLLTEDVGRHRDIVMLLKKFNITARLADDWRRGIPLVKQAKPDVFFIDAEISGVDAKTIARAMSRDASRPGFIALLEGEGGNERPGDGIDFVIKNSGVTPDSLKGIFDLASTRRPDEPAREADDSTARTAEPASARHERVEQDSGKRLVSPKRLEKAINQTREIRALPFVASELTKLVNMPSVDFREVAECLKRDQGLTAKILKLSNSAFFKREKRIYDIEAAVRIIGLKEIHSIAMGITIVELLRGRQKKRGFNRFAFWEHCIGTAAFADLLAKQLGWEETEEAFISGLLHDLGKALFDDCFSKEYDEMLTGYYRENRPIYEVEDERMGISHTEFARAMSVAWRLPKYVIPPMAGHHMPWKDLEKKVDSGEQLTALVKIADALSIATEQGWIGNGLFEEVPDSILKALGLAPRHVEEVLSTIGERIEELKNILLLYTGEFQPPTQEDIERQKHKSDEKKAMIIRRPEAVLSTLAVCLDSLGAEVTKKQVIDGSEFEGGFDVIFYHPESVEQMAGTAEYILENDVETPFVFVVTDYQRRNLPSDLQAVKTVDSITPPYMMRDVERILFSKS